MARQVFEDFLHSMRFHVTAEAIGNFVPLQMEGYPDAGFSAVTTPELTVESVEYKEGTMIYPQKYPGNPTVTDLTFSRGVTRRDSSFWSWIRGVAEGTGGGNYRATLSIKQFHREKALPREFPGVGISNQTQIDFKEAPARIYHCYECFPIRHKVSADMDATSSEISIMELDCAMEYFEIEEDTDGKTRGDA